MPFNLESKFSPTGDQPQAIEQLTHNILRGDAHNVLLGVTGSGKTFTMANVIQNLNRPTLILSHNKTLAAQLYGEFKAFFPNNAVEYFVSYYDYYQPEAYLPTSDTYIEKDLAINDEIERLRLSTTNSLLSGRKDVIVISSVSCLYGIGNPDDFHANTIPLKRDEKYKRKELLFKLVEALYVRSDDNFERGTFRVNGDTIDVWVSHIDIAYRITQWGDFIESIQIIDPTTGKRISIEDEVCIPPASNFVTTKERINGAIKQIEFDLEKQYLHFINSGEDLYAKRLKQRVNYDMEMIKEVGYCSGIENYSRYFDGREPGSRPFCLLDYFPKNYLMMIDESHVTIPQIHAMYGGDASRKVNLVDFGFRLPASKDNRPLKFEEFAGLQPQTIYVTATPANYELDKAEGVVVEQLIRPTGLLDPEIEVRSTVGQIDNLLEEIDKRTKSNERVLVTTLTKRMAEELTKFFDKNDVRASYIHSDVDTIERIEIIDDLRIGRIDVLVGVNLLREGLDIPEVSLVAIMDADKEGFLRSERSLTQTAGRAARNVNGQVIMYADVITGSMQKMIEKCEYRRFKQRQYNEQNGITPTAIHRELNGTIVGDNRARKAARRGDTVIYDFDAPKEAKSGNYSSMAAQSEVPYSSQSDLQSAIDESREMMETAAKELDFLKAALYRDRMYELQKHIQKK